MRFVKSTLAAVAAAVTLLALGGASASADAPPNRGKVQVSHLYYNALGADALANRWQERIYLHNTTSASLDVGGWKVHDTYKNAAGNWGNVYAFPVGTTLAAGETVVVTSAGPEDSAKLAGIGVRVFYMGFTRGYNGHWLNNGGDTVFVEDAAGKRVTRLTYDFDNGYYVR